MTDRVFPASKPTPATNGAPPSVALTPPPAPPSVNGNGTTNGITNQKPQLYIPSNRPVYRPQPYSRHHHHQTRPSCRRICCCCCCWSILILLILALITSIAATAMYVIYHPRPPLFSVPSLRINRLNLTTSLDTSHLSSSFNFTLISVNPNQHLTFSYDHFAVTVKSVKSDETLANGTVPGFFSGNGNKTSFRGVIATSTSARELDPEEARRLKLGLARTRVGLEIEMRTKVKMEMGKLKSEGVEIKVTCRGFEGTVPKGKVPTVAISKQTKCKSDLSVKVWKWSL